MQKSLPLLKVPVAAACRGLVASRLLGAGHGPHGPAWPTRVATGQGPEPQLGERSPPLTQGGPDPGWAQGAQHRGLGVSASRPPTAVPVVRAPRTGLRAQRLHGEAQPGPAGLQRALRAAGHHQHHPQHRLQPGRCRLRACPGRAGHTLLQDLPQLQVPGMESGPPTSHARPLGASPSPPHRACAHSATCARPVQASSRQGPPALPPPAVGWDGHWNSTVQGDKGREGWGGALSRGLKHQGPEGEGLVCSEDSGNWGWG